jgi:glycosyltransferase involved in cell wall biosynthesis
VLAKRAWREIALYSVIIPAYNEEKWLPTTLSALKEAMDALEMPGEIIVVDNNSTDDTAWVAQECGVQVIFEPINNVSRARNAGAKIAKGRYLVFLDADTLVSPELLRKALFNLSTGSCCGGGAQVTLDEPKRPIAQKIVGFANRILPLRYRILPMKTAVALFVYCLREGFDGIGGFDEDCAVGDVRFSRRLRAWGKERDLVFKVITEPPVLTSSRKFDVPRQWWFATLVHFGAFSVASVLFPFVIRSRALYEYWHRRPKTPGDGS